MAIIRDDYLFPIYCENAVPVFGEKNFYATGADLKDTILDADLFVKKSGDEMYGDLVMTGTNPNGITTGIVTNRIDTNNNTGIRIAVENDDYFQLNNNFIFAYKTLIIDTIHGRTDTKVSFQGDRLVDVQDPLLDQDAVTKNYLKDIFDFLKNEILELEEEIEILAPTVERGFWMYTGALEPQDGEYSLIDNGSAFTNQFNDAVKLRITAQSSTGAISNKFDDVSGQSLQIFNQDNDSYALYKILGSTENTTATPNYWELDLLFSQSYSHVPGDPPEAINLGRIKIFTEPSSGVPTGVVCFWPHEASVPAGWLALDGSAFDHVEYQALHLLLARYPTYQEGILPDYSDRYAGAIGTNNAGDAGDHLGELTKLPNTAFTLTATTISHTHTASFTHGHTVTLTGTVGTTGSSHSHVFSIKRNKDNGTKNTGDITNYVSEEDRSGWESDTKTLTTSDGGTHTHTLTISGETVDSHTGTVTSGTYENNHTHTFSGGDATTRPKTVIGYWIIKT